MLTNPTMQLPTNHATDDRTEDEHGVGSYNYSSNSLARVKLQNVTPELPALCICEPTGQLVRLGTTGNQATICPAQTDPTLWQINRWATSVAVQEAVVQLMVLERKRMGTQLRSILEPRVQLLAVTRHLVFVHSLEYNLAYQDVNRQPGSTWLLDPHQLDQARSPGTRAWLRPGYWKLYHTPLKGKIRGLTRGRKGVEYQKGGNLGGKTGD
jgi:hypothetical protein